MDAIGKINRSPRLRWAMRVPLIYYYDAKSGVLLMERVKIPNESSAHMEQFAQMFIELFRVHYHRILSDIMCGNIGVDKEGRFVVIDLGL